MKAIQTENLTKYYGKSRGIINVNLNVEKGDFFGFIGPNGAGKSTTIRTLLGLIQPTSGSAQIFGKDITKYRTEILSNVGFLPSDALFYSGMKIGELLQFSANLRKKDCRKEALELCERLELDPSRKIDALSLGNRKKVGIVCALQHKPDLYILDEPTSGLDPLMQREFYSILKGRNEDGATIFLSSHILSEVSRYCKHAGVIKEGKLLTIDSVEKLGHTGAKRIILRGITTAPTLEHMLDVKIENDNVQFLYTGDMNTLLRQLQSVSFEDINILDPDLEEIFMHYYEKEDC